MTWFGMVSAVVALVIGAMFAVNAYFQFATGVSGWLYVGAAMMLLSGGFRTLRKMSGGLRLLAGAWGVAAGILAVPLSATRTNGAAFDTGGAALFAIALVALVLTVLHKETKKA